MVVNSALPELEALKSGAMTGHTAAVRHLQRTPNILIDAGIRALYIVFHYLVMLTRCQH